VQDEDVIATARQENNFVPSLGGATFEANPGIESATLPRTTTAFTETNTYGRTTGVRPWGWTDWAVGFALCWASGAWGP
jgi:hypothetical protein